MVHGTRGTARAAHTSILPCISRTSKFYKFELDAVANGSYFTCPFVDSESLRSPLQGTNEIGRS